MSQLKEESLRKIVGLLISVLGSEYSDSRDLAIAQLVQLAPKSIQYLNSYLMDESNILKDIAKLKEVANKSFKKPGQRFYGYGPRDEESLKDELLYIELKKKYDSQVKSRNNEVRKLVKDIESKYKIKLLLPNDSDDVYIQYVQKLEWPVEYTKTLMNQGVHEVLRILGEKNY